MPDKDKTGKNPHEIEKISALLKEIVYELKKLNHEELRKIINGIRNIDDERKTKP